MTNYDATKPEIKYEKAPLSHDQLLCEVNYIKAQQILESMLEKGHISLSEFNEITILNRQSFSPALAPLMSYKR